MKNHRAFQIVAVLSFVVLGPVTSFLSAALGDEPFIQADVYNALFEAYVWCDDNFDQTRSEFLTEKLKHDSGRISIESLKKILNYNVEVANEAIARNSRDRELLVSEILGADQESTDQLTNAVEEDKGRHEEVRKIDAFLKETRQHVEVHQCVLEAL